MFANACKTNERMRGFFDEKREEVPMETWSQILL